LYLTAVVIIVVVAC